MTPVDHVAALQARVAARDPDARLLAICDRMSILNDQITQNWRAKEPGYIDRNRELIHESDSLTDELVKRPARTAAGRPAKGEVAVLGIMGQFRGSKLARSALEDYRNAGIAPEAGQ